MKTPRVWSLGGEAPGGLEWLWDRGFRFGMSVFETVAVCEGRPLFLEEHLLRLGKAAGELLDIQAAELINLARQFPDDLGTGVVRFYITAGPGSLAGPCSRPSGYAIFETMPIPGEEHPLRLVTERAPALAAPGGWKTGNYWQNLRALQNALLQGADESVLTSPGGWVIGCACGNLFARIDGRLVTPPRESGARDGVIREWVLARSDAMEDMILPEDLARASAVFVTNSRRGIGGVSELDGRPLPGDACIQGLQALYHHEVLQG